MLTDDQLREAMEVIGLSPDDFGVVHESREAVAELKRRAKAAYKRAVLELHPDRTGGDEVKAELFKAVSVVMDEISELRFRGKRGGKL